jgi:hypothetical protein
MREAELKHGRVAMLAALGWFMVDIGFHLPGTQRADPHTHLWMTAAQARLRPLGSHAPRRARHVRRSSDRVAGLRISRPLASRAQATSTPG